MDANEREMQDRQHPVEENIVLQRKLWRFERVGWFVLVAVVILTLCGLFSRGPISSTETTSANGNLQVEYERFHRNGSVNSMVIHARGKPNQPLLLDLSAAVLRGFSVESIQPQPIASSSSQLGISFTLQTDGHGESVLYLALRSDGVGLFKTRIQTGAGEQVSISQFIYP
jgi:hypothetical protein